MAAGCGGDGGRAPGEPQAAGAGEEHPGLAEVMGRLAAGDAAALITLQDRFRPELVGALRRVARARGARLPADDLDELVLDLAIELARLAPAWSPTGGAPPWVWARHRVAEVVDRHLGQWTSSLDDDHHERAAEAEGAASAGCEPAVVAVFERLAATEPRLGLLDQALRQVASPRDRALFLETAVQRSMGDRSPAATVARAFGLRPEAVRQQDHRVRRRVQQLAATDPRFAPLAALAVVA